MKRINVSALALIFTLACTALTSAFGGDTRTVKGLITARTADTITVRADGAAQTITLTDETKVQSPKGLGIRKEQMSWASLIPGL